MDIRIPLGTAAAVLLLLPLGYQLYNSTALTQVQLREEAIEAPKPMALPAGQAPAAPPPAPSANQPVAPESMAEMARDMDASAPSGAQPLARQVMAPAPAMESESFAAPMPSIAPSQPSGDTFTQFEESGVKAVAEQPVSTFSIDVDTASYSYVRRMLEQGSLPEPDAVRIEEMINYFPYDYPAPADPAVPFQATVSVFPTPWNARAQLLHIGIKGYVPPATEARRANLVFLIDTSGSMDEPDKLPLLKRAFALLLDQLDPGDSVGIVAYAGSAGLVLEPTPAGDKAKILAALDGLAAGGSTAGAEGIELAYKLAESARIQGGINRVILATDGDFNVGIDDPDDLEDFVKARRDNGISLSVLGFGQGNLDDATMQALAQNGNGNAAYIDSFREAQKVLSEEVGSTLLTIAKDVKVQVEFNPNVVSEYRLLGYETRALQRQDFNNDRVDAGDIGAGHTVTAIYEITPEGSDAALIDPLRYGNNAAPQAASSHEIAHLRLRYKLPEESDSKLMELPVTRSMATADPAAVGDDQRFAAAVAAFGQKLKDSDYVDMDWSAIRSLAQSARGSDEHGYRAEFMQLIDLAESIKPDNGLPNR